MKIAFLITSTGWGGLEMNVVKLAKLLVSKNYEIVLLTQEKSTIYITGKEYFTNSFLLDKNKKHFDFKSAKNVSYYLKKNKINTLLVFDNKDLDLATWTKKLFYTKIKIIYQQHMQIGINKKDFIHTFRYNSIDCWISPLGYLKNEVMERTKFPKEKIKVIPICLDTSKFINKKYSKEEALKLLNISPKFPLLGIIGRISEKKGQLFLIDSLIRLKQQGVFIELLIFGSATVNDVECQEYNKLIIEKVKNNNLEQVVHFIEFREDVSQFYNAVDIFAMASEGETYGMVTIEAMLSKLPIIATNSGGTSEVLNFGKFGLLYEQKNSSDFCEKLVYLITNTETTHKMIDEAFENAKTKYASEIEIEGIDKLIRGFN